jgi:hypothetical protein
METAKVDIRKLQMLNDCINRTIEALNQVRLSVHGGGLSHSSPYGMQSIGSPALMAGYPGAFASPYAALAPQMLGVVPGMGHSAASPYASPFATSPLAYWASQQSPWTQQAAWTQQIPWAQTGLGHTAMDSRLSGYEYVTDPYVTARIAQTFPFVHWGYSPFGWPSI